MNQTTNDHLSLRLIISELRRNPRDMLGDMHMGKTKIEKN